ncbi:AraC family transcriptional regulator [Aestuariicella hydrocarbonica]|uniref:AraC family transcriptional regulator n=1 Tax=Pseudomaricurvus hydrocarbonicus TaxID=1470433 RepID=A0A9E5MNR2_9GAMM|nr:helix-turn-helix domain-containing protein [Aestuariicella hydrocarbonica]NHO67615.1 AraC family transcriptional regulator [Aestuariicella hydrocarbonica]
MVSEGLHHQAAFNRRRHASASGPRQLVENRTVYESHSAELSIYDTFAVAERVRLDAEELLYCGMISGKKVLHGRNHFNAPFLPHESFVMAPGETIEIDFPEASFEAPTSCLALGISRSRLREVCDRLNDQRPRPRELGEWRPQAQQALHLLHTEATQQLLVRIVGSFLGNDDDRDLVLDLGVTELLTRMLRQQGREFLQRCARQDPTLTGLTHAVHYIDTHLSEGIDIDQLCRIACMSRSKLYQQFRQVMDVGPKEYIHQRRLERARELIASGQSITSVCYEVGYVNPSHFTRRFHQQYGLSPRDYGQRHRKDSTRGARG